jgi:hypothetical protein
MITVVVDALRRQKSDSLERQLAALVARMNPRRILPPEVRYAAMRILTGAGCLSHEEQEMAWNLRQNGVYWPSITGYEPESDPDV